MFLLICLYLQTIQTIAFIAHLRVRVEAPFLVVCPLSVLHNWIDEFTRFAPEVTFSFILSRVALS
jgi:SNF2 family DNA or RNA helicase